MGRAYQELGHINRDMGNEQKAITHYRQACELNPALLASWNSLYKYFNENNNKPAADHALEQINKLKSLPGVLLYIEQILNEGRLGLAENKCREFLKKNPTHTYAMSLLSEIANRMGYFDDAEFLLEKAVSFKPNDGELRMKYASILRKKQKFAKTMEQVNILCEKYSTNKLIIAGHSLGGALATLTAYNIMCDYSKYNIVLIYESFELSLKNKRFEANGNSL